MSEGIKPAAIRVTLRVEADMNMLAPRAPFERAAWLGRFGTPPRDHKRMRGGYTTVFFRGTPGQWAALDLLTTTDGTLEIADKYDYTSEAVAGLRCPHGLAGRVFRVLRGIVAGTGRLPEELGAEVLGTAADEDGGEGRPPAVKPESGERKAI